MMAGPVGLSLDDLLDAMLENVINELYCHDCEAPIDGPFDPDGSLAVCEDCVEKRRAAERSLYAPGGQAGARHVFFTRYPKEL